MNPGEIVAISGFLKNFEDPIEYLIDSRFANGLLTLENVSEAKIYGVEFELRKGLEDILEPLGGFNLGMNLSLVHSVVDIPEAELEVIRVNHANAKSTRPFQGQSPYLLNLDLSYNHTDYNFNAGVFFNVFGDRLSYITEGANPDVYERALATLDFKLTKGFARRYKFSFSVKNLLNEDVKFSQELPNGNEFIYRSYNKGRTFSFGIGAEL
jgi:outer membrane receptor protein involved in Fe transport